MSGLPDWEAVVDNSVGAVDDHRRRIECPESCLLERLAIALRLTMEEMTSPVQSGVFHPDSVDGRRFEKGKRFAEGWDAAVDYVNRRLNDLLLHTDDEGMPWPYDLDSFRAEFSRVYKKR